MRRGLVLNLISNVMFFVSGYVLHFFLGNSMSAASYGVVGTIITVLDFEYMFVSNGARQSLSSEISRHRYDIADVIRKTTAFQSLVILAFFLLNYFGAPWFGVLFNDASLDFYFKVAGLLVIVNGLQVILLGINDGLHRFGVSAALSTFYPIAKLGTIPLIVFVFHSDPVLGVEIGFIIAVVATILLGCVLLVPVRNQLRSDGGERIAFKEVARHTLSFSFFFIVVSLVLSVDTLVVKAVVEPADMAGYYTGAMNFGKIAYYLLQAFSIIILPVVAKLIGLGDDDGAKQRIRELILLACAVILPIPVIISASSGPLLSVFYNPDFTVASSALSFLSLSNFFMGMTVVLNMVLSSYDDSRFSDVLSLVSLVVVIPLFVVAARYGGITAIAMTSMGCTTLMMLVSIWRVKKHIGSLFTSRSWGSIVGAAALWLVTALCFHVAHVDNLIVLGALYVMLYAAYMAALLVCRVLPWSMIKNLRS